MRYIISGGGTGGHIFPAIAIAKAIKLLDEKAEILFVGAENRMEMQIVPAHGFNIEGLPVAGFSRSQPLINISVIFKLYKSLRKAKKVLKTFKPQVAIGVGGYASGPVLKEAQKQGIPTLIQEQNSYAGVTNKLLAKKADYICVAYEGMDKFFPSGKIIKTGNPIRPEIKESLKLIQKDAKKNLGFDPDRMLVVSIGGSLGAKSLNDAIDKSLNVIKESDSQLLWQTGKRFYDDYKDKGQNKDEIKVVPFIDRMDIVYAAADLLISRAGASTISEIQYLGKPVILIPSPNVAEDHQRKNAEALSDINAAITILDSEASESLPRTLRKLLSNPSELNDMAKKVKEMSIGNADEQIASISYKLAKER